MCASEIGCISVIPLRFVHVTSRAGSALCLITECRSAVWTDRCLTAHPLRDVWVVFSFRLLRMKLPCTSLYKFLCENRFNLSGINAQLPATAGSRGESVFSAKDLPAESQASPSACSPAVVTHVFLVRMLLVWELFAKTGVSKFSSVIFS